MFHRRQVLSFCRSIPLLGIALMTAPAWSQVTSIAVAGILGAKALLVIDDGKPRSLGPGESFQDVRVLSIQGNTVVLEVGGLRRSLRVGEAPFMARQSVPQPKSEVADKVERILLTADAQGRFVVPGTINARPVQFIVDMQSPEIVLGRPDADRLRLKYRDGETVEVGSVQGWRIRLDSVRIQDVEVRDVDATIVDQPQSHVLLGRSFLARFQWRRDSREMVLTKRHT